MALGSRKRDYVTGNRSVKNALAMHSNRMNELIKGGMSKSRASTKAYDELQAGKLGKVTGKKKYSARKSASRSKGRGWFGDPTGHSAAAKR